MVVYSFYVFDRHAECIYKKKWLPASLRPVPQASRPTSSSSTAPPGSAGIDGAAVNTPGAVGAGGEGKGRKTLSAEDDAKLVFGAIHALRGIVRNLGGMEDCFVSYRTGHYKLHYYETPTNIKFVMVTDIKTNNLRAVLHQIYVGLFVEYVVKNPLSPVEHPGGIGVNCEMFELGLEQFIGGL